MIPSRSSSLSIALDRFNPNNEYTLLTGDPYDGMFDFAGDATGEAGDALNPQPYPSLMDRAEADAFVISTPRREEEPPDKFLLFEN